MIKVAQLLNENKETEGFEPEEILQQGFDKIGRTADFERERKRSGPKGERTRRARVIPLSPKRQNSKE